MRRPGVGEVRDRLLRVVRGRPVDPELALELLSGQLREQAAVQRGGELARGVEDGVAAEHGRPRRRRLAGVQLLLGVDDDADAPGRQAEDVAGDLTQDGVDALSRLRPGVEQRERAVGLGTQDRAAVFGDAVADPRVLQAAGDAGEARAP
jgi:hypothetical protein